MTTIILQRVKDYHEAEDGSGFSWVSGETICTFHSPNDAMDYVEANKDTLPKDARFFTGSASLIVQLNSFLTSIREQQVA